MIALVLAFTVAAARPPERQLEQYLEWYSAGEHDRLWEAASDAYRTRTCAGDPAQCPDLGRIPLGDRQSTRLSCDRPRGRCTWTRTDRYDAPPLPYTDAVDIEWIVTTDLDGRFAGVSVNYSTPGTGGRVLAAFSGVGCGMLSTFLLVWVLLFGIVHVRLVPREDVR